MYRQTRARVCRSPEPCRPRRVKSRQKRKRRQRRPWGEHCIFEFFMLPSALCSALWKYGLSCCWTSYKNVMLLSTHSERTQKQQRKMWLNYDQKFSVASLQNSDVEARGARSRAQKFSSSHATSAQAHARAWIANVPVLLLNDVPVPLNMYNVCVPHALGLPVWGPHSIRPNHLLSYWCW